MSSFRSDNSPNSSGTFFDRDLAVKKCDMTAATGRSVQVFEGA